MIKVGVVDSGFSAHQQEWIVDSAAFVMQDNSLWMAEAEPDQLGHGSHIIDTIRQVAPDTCFYLAQVFQVRFTTSTGQVSAAIDWLIEQEVDVINMSLGLRQDRDSLRDTIQAALNAGIVICASSPAKGDPVYPAAYPGVFRMTGDARCAAEEWSYLETEYADFGGHVKSADGQQAGASMGTARLSGHICNLLLAQSSPISQSSQIVQSDQASYLSQSSLPSGKKLSLSEIRRVLQQGASYFGPEHKGFTDQSAGTQP
ncbi:subtilisin-like serine protease QhpE [Oceanospirillum beijerinckii]|uniref:subtilisin-like serine protease QhpE n=1 Tax=Oceanospirillum beijerinckii TaxID=64976 RepID=UPI000414EE15|nr:S8 family serine peptidase [Oceanospirillum beijerinckii]